MASGKAELFKSAGVWAYGTLLHVCVRSTGGVVSLHINGQVDRSVAYAYTSVGGQMSVGFSDFGSNFYPFNGVLDEFAVWQRGLSDAEILASAQAVDSVGGAGALSEPRIGTVPLRGVVAASAAVGSPSILRALCSDVALDIEFGGRGRIYGTVSIKVTPSNVPVARRVRLLRSRDSYLARETWSKPDGTYSFDGINEQYEYDVVVFDHELNYFSQVANNKKPEVA